MFRDDRRSFYVDFNKIFLKIGKQRHNNEATNQFKEIGPILKKFIFLPVSIINELSLDLKEKLSVEDQTYFTVFQDLMKRLSSFHQTHNKNILERIAEKEKLSFINNQFRSENKDLKSQVFDLKNKLKSTTDLLQSVDPKTVAFYYYFTIFRTPSTDRTIGKNT